MINLLRGGQLLRVNERIKLLREFQIVFGEESVQNILVGRLTLRIVNQKLNAVKKNRSSSPRRLKRITPELK